MNFYRNLYYDVYQIIYRSWQTFKFGIFVCFRAITKGWKPGQLKVACFYFSINSSSVELGKCISKYIKSRVLHL